MLLDLEAFPEKATPRTKMVLLTNPNNPTGTVFTRSQLTALAEFIVERDLILVVDQAFEDSVFDGREMVSMASLPGMWNVPSLCSPSPREWGSAAFGWAISLRTTGLWTFSSAAQST